MTKTIDEKNIFIDAGSDPIELAEEYKKSLIERKQEIDDYILLKSKGRIHESDFDEDLADEIISFCENEVTEFITFTDNFMAFIDEHISELRSIDILGYPLGLYTCALTAYMSIHTALILANHVRKIKRNINLTRTQKNS